jgi:hypothetical protein
VILRFLVPILTPISSQVDPEWPERHQEFDVEYVQRIKHGDYVRSGYHIRTEVGLKDKDLWSAVMYQGAGFENRAVLVKGPCRSFWYDKIEDYHRRGFCNETKDSHISTLSKLANNEDRRFQHWLLIFKEDVTLDNILFSGDPIHVQKKSIGLKETIETIKCRSSMLYWVITKRHGGFRRKEEKKDMCKTCSISSKLLLGEFSHLYI